jgi:regulator of protease activity HflC (stomatin/prohibitin superfamily)
MESLAKLLMDVVTLLWPFHLVKTWEQGLYFVCGRYQWTCRPGLKLVIPWFCEVKCVSIVPEIETTPLQTVTLRDGQTLTYSASLTIQVVDAERAYNRVGHWSETIIELSAGVVSACLADAEPRRIIDPSRSKRENLLDEIRDEINAVASAYGVEVRALRLNNFALGIPTLRLLMDKSVLETKH